LAHQVVVTQVQLHEAGQWLEGVADGADDVEAEIEALERGQILEGVLLDVTDPIVVEIDDFEVGKTSEAFFAQRLERVTLEDQLLKLAESADQFIWKFLDVIVGNVQVPDAVVLGQKLAGHHLGKMNLEKV
jgi:hypothetical protein